MTLENFLYRSRIRYAITVVTGIVIRPTNYRFSSDWRHADSGLKAWFYRLCCTFAANYIADDDARFGVYQIKHWRNYL